ncbi:MAG: cell division protein FtsQ/DivIB [Nocardioidaceae bacterium]
MSARKSGSQAQFSRRKWRSRLGRLRVVLIMVTVVAVVAFAGWVVLASPWLAVDNVEVSGGRHVSESTIVQAAAITSDTPMARVNLDDVAARVEAVPAVAAATVHRGWPHTISIEVTEREPVAAVHRHGSWWVVDKEGVLFHKTAGREKSVPVIEVHAHPYADAVREAASVVAQLPAKLLDRVRRVTTRSMDSISLSLRDHRKVVWGSSAESARKIRVLRVLLRRDAHVYDVRVPERPTTE